MGRRALRRRLGLRHYDLRFPQDPNFSPKGRNTTVPRELGNPMLLGWFFLLVLVGWLFQKPGYKFIGR